jgi:hypothetical protein
MKHLSFVVVSRPAWGNGDLLAARRRLAKLFSNVPSAKHMKKPELVLSITRDVQGKVQYHYSIVEVNAHWRSGDAQPASDVTEARWVTLPELRSMNVWSEMLRVVELGYAQLVS